MDKKVRKFNLFNNTQIIIGATIIFAVIMLFFDNNNIQIKQQITEKIELLTAERDSLLLQIESDSVIINGIQNDDVFLERYAREHFYMKREGEEIFIIERDSSK